MNPDTQKQSHTSFSEDGVDHHGKKEMVASREIHTDEEPFASDSFVQTSMDMEKDAAPTSGKRGSCRTSHKVAKKTTVAEGFDKKAGPKDELPTSDNAGIQNSDTHETRRNAARASQEYTAYCFHQMQLGFMNDPYDSFSDDSTDYY